MSDNFVQVRDLAEELRLVANTPYFFYSKIKKSTEFIKFCASISTKELTDNLIQYHQLPTPIKWLYFIAVLSLNKVLNNALINDIVDSDNWCKCFFILNKSESIIASTNLNAEYTPKIFKLDDLSRPNSISTTTELSLTYNES